MNLNDVKEIFSDEAFVKELFSAETPAEAQAMLKEKGFEVTEEDLMAVREVLVQIADGTIPADKVSEWQAQLEEDELPEELLEMVSGGAITEAGLAMAAGMTFAGPVGVLVGACVVGVVAIVALGFLARW